MKKNKTPNLKIDTNFEDDEFKINEYGSFMTTTTNFASPSPTTTTTTTTTTSSNSSSISSLKRKEKEDFPTPKMKQQKKILSPKSILKEVESLTGSLPCISPNLPEIIKQSPLFKNDYNNFDDVINDEEDDDDDDEFKSIEDGFELEIKQEKKEQKKEEKKEKRTKEELQSRAKEIKREADKEHKKGNIKRALHFYIQAGIKFLEAASIGNEYQLYRDICTYFQQIGNVSMQSNNSSLNIENEIGLCFCGASISSLNVILIKKEKIRNDKKDILKKFEKQKIESFIRDVDFMFIYFDCLKKMNQFLLNENIKKNNPFNLYNDLNINVDLIIKFIENSIKFL
eukprot:gene2639-3836_t